MNKFKKLAAVAMMVIVPLFAHADQANPDLVKALMQKIGAGNVGKQAMEQMIPALKQMVPDAPESFWDDVLAEVNADELENLIIPVYQKHFNDEDIKAINAFYDTPAGQKMIGKMPVIMQESMAIGQQWGQQLAQEVLQKYEEQKK